jgi:hypothetical protein
VTDREEKSPVEQAVERAFDLFVYAPIGILFEGSSLLPELVAKGKSQVALARMMGQFAVGEAQKRANGAASKLQDQAAGVIDFLGDSVVGAPAEEPAAEPPRVAAAAPVAEPPSAGGEAPAGPPVDVSTLAIPDYDGLSASQVVNRLAGLSRTELEHVQRYEAGHRGRKTILSKVAQLQGR